MKSGLLRRAGRLFAEALDKPASERGRYLDRVCPHDAALRAEVVALLERHESACPSDFLVPPEPADLSSRLRAIGETVPTEEGQRRAKVLEGRVLEGRYRIGRILGHGTFSSVVQAEDLLSGEEVAVKLLDSLSREELSLVRREVAILRILRLPGVVQMLDEGTYEGVPFIVMEQVHGEPFGGGGTRAWSEIEPTVLSLLETLSRIHWAGVLHRDLKPDNVLEGPDGRTTVLDLGTATESGARTRFLSRSHLAGTPLYIAPEQLRGASATVQSDLYAVGVMIYRCLSGRAPHTAEDLAALIQERLSGPAPSLAEAAPAAPAVVVEVVDRLLALDPDARPTSAAETVALLRGDRRTRPRLALLSGRPRAEPLTAEELEPLFKGSERLFHLRHDAARELFRRTGGLPDRIDDEVDGWVRAGLARWEDDSLAINRAAVDRLATGLRVTPPALSAPRGTSRPGGDIEDVLGLLVLAGSPLSTPAVSATLDYPPAKAGELLGALLARGDVRRASDDGYEALAPSASLGEWPEGKRRDLGERLAAALEPGEEGRLRLLLAAGRVGEVPAEALACARRLLTAGHVGEARMVVLEGLIAGRDVDEPEVEAALHRTLVELSLLEGRAASIDEALYWLCRSGEFQDESLVLEMVARAALLALKGDGARALELIDSLPEDTDPDVQRISCSVSVFAARNSPQANEEAVVTKAVTRMRQVDDPRCGASAAEWMGWLRYGQGRFPEAAELHEEAAALAINPPARLSALLNSASAWMEAGDLSRAEAQARQALSVAGECRHPLHEARAEWILRSVTYRSGRDIAADRELADATRALGSPNLEGLILLTEAAFAWRRGEGSDAIEFANRASAVWCRMGQSAGRILAACLAAAAGSGPRPDEARALLDAARNCPVPGIATQALGLLARAVPHLGAECLAAARGASAKIPEEGREARREVISIAEALQPAPPGTRKEKGK